MVALSISHRCPVGRAGGPGKLLASQGGCDWPDKALAARTWLTPDTVNAVAPAHPHRPHNDLPEDLKEATMEKRFARGRLGDSRRIAAAVAFLASDEAGYITGHVFSVDGGMVMM